MSDGLPSPNLRGMLHGVRSMRERVQSAKANGVPEAGIVPGYGMAITAGNAGVMVPNAIADRVCDALEDIIRDHARETGADIGENL